MSSSSGSSPVKLDHLMCETFTPFGYKTVQDSAREKKQNCVGNKMCKAAKQQKYVFKLTFGDYIAPKIIIENSSLSAK